MGIWSARAYIYIVLTVNDPRFVTEHGSMTVSPAMVCIVTGFVSNTGVGEPSSPGIGNWP